MYVRLESIYEYSNRNEVNMKYNVFCFALGVCAGIAGLLAGVYISEERAKYRG